MACRGLPWQQPNVSQDLAVQAANAAFRRAVRLTTADHAETINELVRGKLCDDLTRACVASSKLTQRWRTRGGGTLGLQNPSKLVGLACTAALTTSRDRRGSNRCFVATCTGGKVLLHKLRLHKGDNTREEESCLVSR